MKLLKGLIGAAVVTGVSAWAAMVAMERQRQREELDEFLVPSDDGPVEIEIQDGAEEEAVEEEKAEETEEEKNEEE